MTQNRNIAIQQNIIALRTLALEIGSHADEAINSMTENNTNLAIGTLVYVQNSAELIGPLMKVIMALHRLPENDAGF